MSDRLSDEALMAAYLAGDERAFKELFLRTAPAIHNFFSRAFRSRALADDLLQTTFLHVHRARRTFEKGRALRPWLFAIAARVRLDELRRRYGMREDADEDVVSRAADAAEQQEPRDPESAAAAAETAEVVRQALEGLPSSQRVVVHLHRYEGMTFAEIAGMLGTTEGAVKLRAFRAYSELRRRLAGLVGGDKP